MVDKQRRLVCSLLFLLALIRVGSCLKCYQCTEEVGGNKECEDAEGNKSPTTRCQIGKVCVYHELNPTVGVLGKKIPGTIIKMCHSEDYCETAYHHVFENRLRVSTKTCSVCKTDYCNPGSRIKDSVFDFVVALLLVVKYFFQY